MEIVAIYLAFWNRIASWGGNLYAPQTYRFQKFVMKSDGIGGTECEWVDTLNVRNKPSTDGAPIAQYHKGDTINFDGWLIVNGYRWGTYISYSGVRRYVAYRDESDGTYFMSY